MQIISCRYVFSIEHTASAVFLAFWLLLHLGKGTSIIIKYVHIERV